MDSFLERLDRAATSIVPMLYLLGMIAGTAYYFTDGSNGFLLNITTVGLFLAGASELHSFLQQRRTRIAWKRYQQEHDPEKSMQARGEFWGHLGILAALIAFQCFTAIMYRAETWHPSNTLLPAQAQIILSGCAIPLLFLLAGFLATVAADYKEMLEQATLQMMGRTLRGTVRQWGKRMQRIERTGKNLAPLSVEMLRFQGQEDLADFVATVDTTLQGIETPQALPPPPTTPHIVDADEQEDAADIFEGSALEIQAYKILREHPNMNIRQLSDALGCAYSTAHPIWYRVRDALGITSITRAAPQKRSA